mmetsp:Transcript_2525/g.3714  ORF Transcript_2525/g.3714 Transcript_2525/m.3714 type:complete len:120 (+) Transcript_2525:123-482(+)
MIYSTRDILKENRSFDSRTSYASTSSCNSTPSFSNSLSIGVIIRKDIARKQEAMKRISETNWDVEPGQERKATTTRRTKRGTNKLTKQYMVKTALDCRREKIAQYKAIRLLYTLSGCFD